MNMRSSIWSILFFAGLVTLFVGERLIGAGGLRAGVSGAGAALVAIAFAVRALRSMKASEERRGVERTLLMLHGLAVAALGLYVLQSDVWTKLTGAALDKGSPTLAGALSALWPAVMGLALIPTFLIELAYAPMQQAPKVEAGRVRDALLSGFGATCAIIFAFCAYYVASERDVKWDLSYFRTAKPGDSTRSIIRQLDDPLEVSVFFPPANEVREQVVEYLNDLQAESPQFKVVTYDQALDPKRARELGVTGNGTVVVARGERKELMAVGLELQKARTQLRSFDQEFQKRLLNVARARRTIYFTTGHGERATDKTAPVDQRWTTRLLRDEYKSQNFDVRNLGVAEGLASEVPQDAAAVVIAGATESFLPEELAALDRYLARGGRVLLALDPDVKADFGPLLSKHGLRYQTTMLANDQVYLARTRQPSDRINIATASYSSHPSVTSLGRLGQRAPVLMVGSGALEQADKPADVRVDFTVHSHPQTFSDANGNYELDAPGESRRVFELAAAVSKGTGETESRMLVFADSDVLGDPVMENPGNAYLALDGMKWLLGDEATAGTVNSEEDKPIEHTRKQDVVWFYASIYLAPALVLGVGFWFTRRGGSQRRKVKTEARS